MANILIIDDNPTLRDGVSQVIQRMGHRPFVAASGVEGLKLFRKHQIDFTISDLKMDGLDGIQVTKRILEMEEDALVMIITAHGTIETAVEAMKEGAFDFITKPFPPSVLRLKVERAIQVQIERERLREENAYLRQELGGNVNFDGIIGSSDAMKQIFKMVQKVARSDSTVYVYGESGTGKELIAQALHNVSPRAHKAFVKVNCGALAETLLESELFGHEKGAFTGAHRRKLGRFELADGGTLFLDEIGDISPVIQLKLLRVLQEREFERVGGGAPISVDVRVISATNKDLKAEVEAGRFREDLFYRLHIIPLSLPPLRERRDDVPLLVEHFVNKLARRTRSDVTGITDDALVALQNYRWPGNVRELENCIEQALVFAEGASITLEDLPGHVSGAPSGDHLELPKDDRSLPEILESLERQLIVRAYRKAKGVKTETARILGIKTSALYYKLDKYEIDETILET